LPFCICPKCGAKFHVRPTDYKEWTAKYEKNRRPDGKYALVFFKCWKEFGEFREEPTPPAGQN